MPDRFELYEDEQAVIGFAFKMPDGKDANVEAGSLQAYSNNSALIGVELNDKGKLVAKALAGGGDATFGIRADADLGTGVKPIFKEWQAFLKPRMADHVDETDFAVETQPEKMAAKVEETSSEVEAQPAPLPPLTDAEREAARKAEEDAAAQAEAARKAQAEAAPVEALPLGAAPEPVV